MSGTTDAIITGLLRIAPDLVGQLIERLHGASPQDREEMIADMRSRRDAMRARVDAELDARWPADAATADTLPAPDEGGE